MQKFIVLTVVLLGLMLGGCASNKNKNLPVKDPGFYGERIRAEGDRFMEVYDPWQGFNRGSYAFNRQVDRLVLVPLVKGYRAITPKFFRTGAQNFWKNLGEVQVTAASLLQFKFKKAALSTSRLAINSTLGIGGLGDVATKFGISPIREDFGQTFGAWGIPAGPYLVIPFLGPSSLRDGIGLVGDLAVEQAVNLAGMPRSRSDHLALSAFYVLTKRDSVEFRYGQMKSPFEYELVRFAVTEAREILVEE